MSDDYELAKAMNSLGCDASHPNANRAAVLEAMQRVMNDYREDNDWHFLKALVTSIYEASERTVASGRADAVLKACGLAGRMGEHADFLEFVMPYWGLDGYTKSDLIRMARDKNLLPPALDDVTARQILDRHLTAIKRGRADVGEYPPECF